MKRLLLAAALLAAALPLTGCLHKAFDNSMPYYDGVIKGTVDYPLAALAKPGKTYVILSSDPYLDVRLGTVEVGADNAYEFQVAPGEYYISAFRDTDGDGTWTFGDDPVGGRIASYYDLFRTAHPVARMAKTEVVDPVLLHPFDALEPAHLSRAVGTTPVFSWPAVPGCDLYRIRVHDRTGATMWVFDTEKTEVAYGKLTDSADEAILNKPYSLFQGEDYEWVVLGLRKTADGEREVVAYSRLWTFRT